MTKEEARKDIERIAETFKTIGPGTEADRTTQLFLQMFDVLRRRLDQPRVLKILYIDSPGAAEVLPMGMREIVRRLAAGEITAAQADQELIQLKLLYEELIREMALRPAKPIALIGSQGRIVGFPIKGA
ncbi:MAG: hypothetical protein A3B37_03630 [Candidatus Sungbacteria bacterium RIFCSPLOWO2_01_FULL_59_16]|uniref:Uncharacterized protein n=1 Tax=Candidatus Sungbacteria bacterium RIFCSPLOWO2_01_FULL_59_16 TaxID=1802280 RepID=A0A1G2L9K9_9BACT|nr:MAG: hypothetical protein A3B37_03630 [Candidatus Sungbacteria bacterium RIFCSPLOWO2_01_FULL_59_16]